MSYYVHNAGWQDFPTRREAEEDARWDDFVSEAESLETHYADEINGNAVYTDEPEPEPVADQLRLFGVAY
jgi:hypothetical protein